MKDVKNKEKSKIEATILSQTNIITRDREKIVRVMKPNRCKECNKIIRHQNKSKLCSHHYKQLNRKRRKND